MAEVEVRAAHNVLEACAQTETIDKVVFTSSVTAVVWRDGLNTMSSDVDERHWSDINLCKKYKVPRMFTCIYVCIYRYGYFRHLVI